MVYYVIRLYVTFYLLVFPSGGGGGDAGESTAQDETISHQRNQLGGVYWDNSQVKAAKMDEIRVSVLPTDLRRVHTL